MSLSSQPTPSTDTPTSTATYSTTSLTNSGITLKDIEKFISLGCLRLDRPLQHYPASADSTAEWDELTHLNLSEVVSATLGTHVVKLLHAGWIRLFIHHKPCPILVRVFLLPHDVGRRLIDRESKALKSSLRGLLHQVDVSLEAWSGHTTFRAQPFDPWATAEDVSLFYLFNKLPSPTPDPKIPTSQHTRRAMEELLKQSPSSSTEINKSVHGLKTKLYPYQARSAAFMIQRETTPQLQLDPRLEERRSLTGTPYYFGARDGSILLEPRYYETNRGGILAESMGLGKTVICLAVILGTRDHLPQIPGQFQPPMPVRERVGSLGEMVASSIGRNSIPVKSDLRRLEEEKGLHLDFCKLLLDSHVPTYEIPVEVPRMNRTTRIPPPQKLVMCSGTIIVVPRNLLHQWQSEIRKHVVKGGVKILIMDSKSTRRKMNTALNSDEADGVHVRNELPSASELLQYDIVLFSRNRFEQEIQDGADNSGRRLRGGVPLACQCPYIGATRVRDCICLAEERIYESPLKKLHWLRIIIDEGHNFASKNANAVLVAKQIHAERRWVISGTPAKDLVGVEVELPTMDTDEVDPSILRELAIEQRKTFNTEDDTTGAAKNLGLLASNFLMVRPWCDSPAEGKLDWDDYIYRHEHHHKRTYSGFSTCFFRTLEGLVVKTRPEDVERDIALPPMTHRVVYLKPCWYDKMTANLFIQVLRANAITSERVDVDYLFHKNSVQARHSLIRNLRQSNFTWTGFSIEDVAGTLETSAKYLAKEDKDCSLEDANLLLESCQIVASLLRSDSWIALSKSHEVGMFVEEWPQGSEEEFALAYPEKPAMIGITQLLEAQSCVDGHILSEDPSEGLQKVGQAAKAKLAAMEEVEKKTKTKGERDATESTQEKKSVPSSCVVQPVTSRKVAAVVSKASPKKQKKSAKKPECSNPTEESMEREVLYESPVKPKKRRLTLAGETAELFEGSPLRKTRVIGTTSAKLTYLMEKVMKHQEKEKIIIFYDGDNAAFYIAQALEMLQVNHRIYARTLENPIRSKYVALFNEDPDIRVLLIDVACGALGLNLNVASVVLIVNPINRPSIEAQAIKRAHRIGQTKRVLVETLVLEGTIEEAIFNQAKQMSRNEHLEAKTLEDADKIMNIIQNAKVILVEPDEDKGYKQCARLETPQQVFGRMGRGKYQKYGYAERGAGKEGTEKPKKRARASGLGKEKKKVEDLANRALNGIADVNTLGPTTTAPPPASDAPWPFSSLFGEASLT
ncbi:hypothetical protein GQ43DRAFT_481535 [Delitschia confertaspora ATCC 74209]|uniref:Helicase C-terminal domain-containing protein n=1 Tax=Delitschia confertaspora ATCC 74209 TaxID=1513339 RepID=A0A9P4JJB8_9PLEO|nr:hypothetical protein GQ43DRAFT_481535 [Delitschia confertaspora ATCC 74209]